jgi:phage terminase Nu1 subunit (DNA packaging protein)
MGDEIFLTSKQFVIAFKISRETVRKWREKGMPAIEKNKYSLSECLQWVRENIWAPEDEEGGMNEEKLLRERAKRKFDELKEQEKRGELIPRKESVKWVSLLVAECKAALWNIPRRLGPVLAVVNDERECEEILRKEHRKVLEELAKGMKKKGRR